MRSEKNIFIAFILNLAFSIFEFAGGVFTGSVAIISDAVHDIGDAASLSISYFLEKKSKKQPDKKYTYGYARYSVIGSVITTLILLFGSTAVIYNAIMKIIFPTEINCNGMIILALVGVSVNLGAAFLTRHGNSLNQKAVNLHMIEDVLGWAVVLIGAVVMRFTDLIILDPLMSICVAVYILVNAVINLKEALDIFLEKAPRGIEIDEIRSHICEIDGVTDVHHVHLWSIDGHRNYATMHIVTSDASQDIKEKIREELKEHGIDHATIGIETEGEQCHEKHCRVEFSASSPGHHHHHHHHH